MLMSVQRPSRFVQVASLLAAGTVLLIVAPLVDLLGSSSTEELIETAADQEVWQSLQRTLLASAGAVLAGLISGVPLAYLLARQRFWGRSAVLAVLDLPVVIPHTVAGIALLGVIGRDSWVGRSFMTLVGSYTGIMLAMAFVSVPFLVRAAHAGFEAVPPELEKVAQTLGASRTRVFFTVALPLAWRDVLYGALMMWARGISEFGAVVIIAYHPMTMPTLVFERYGAFGLSAARHPAVLLILACIPVFVMLHFLGRRRGGVTRHA